VAVALAAARHRAVPRLPGPGWPVPAGGRGRRRAGAGRGGRPRTSGWELAALAWLVLAAIPLALIDVAVHRLPDPLTAAAFTGALALLAVAALTWHQPGHLARAAVGAAALACLYLALCLIRPGEMGLGDAKLAASTGLVLGWTSCQELLTATFTGFALAAVYGGVLLATHRAYRTSQLPLGLGPFILLGTLAAIALLHATTCRSTPSALQWRRGVPGTGTQSKTRRPLPGFQPIPVNVPGSGSVGPTMFNRGPVAPGGAPASVHDDS
jgi:Flp pilus assembly protein protease CpaA